MEQKQAIFKNLEKTGEVFKQELADFSVRLQKNFETKIQSAKFEAAYAMSVSKAQRVKTMADVKETRSELWAEALKMAKGNTRNAYTFYEHLCSFP